MGSRRLACFLSSRGAHYLFAFLPGHHTHTHTHIPRGTACVCVWGGGLTSSSPEHGSSFTDGSNPCLPLGTKQSPVEAPPFGGGFLEG